MTINTKQNTNNKENLRDDENYLTEEQLARHKQVLEKIQLKEKRKSFFKKKSSDDVSRRLKLLRNVLGLTAEKFAAMCKFHNSKYTRLENSLTKLTKNDATLVCIAVLQNYKLTIDPEWLLGQGSETPPSLMNTKQVQNQVKEYTESFFNKKESFGSSALSISLEMEYLNRIYDKDKKNLIKFMMVNDNRLLPHYKKGDYVCGMVVPRDLWHFLKNGYACIVESQNESNTKVRNVYINDEYVILLTNTKEPELIKKEDINSISVIFYHRYNMEELANLLDMIKQVDLEKKKRE